MKRAQLYPELLQASENNLLIAPGSLMREQFISASAVTPAVQTDHRLYCVMRGMQTTDRTV